MLTFTFQASSSAHSALACSPHLPAAAVVVGGLKQRRLLRRLTVQKAVDRGNGCQHDRSISRKLCLVEVTDGVLGGQFCAEAERGDRGPRAVILFRSNACLPAGLTKLWS